MRILVLTWLSITTYCVTCKRAQCALCGANPGHTRHRPAKSLQEDHVEDANCVQGANQGNVDEGHCQDHPGPAPVPWCRCPDHDAAAVIMLLSGVDVLVYKAFTVKARSLQR